LRVQFREQHCVPVSHTWPLDRQQWPPTQPWPAVQAVPQAPQWLGLLLRLTHWLPQAVKPLLQVKVHTPLLQVFVAALATWHTFQQLPQLRRFVCGSMQPTAQAIWPAGQAHWPLTQMNPEEQWTIQLPQFPASVCRLAHPPKQQISPAGQACPHAPQFWLSNWLSVQALLQQIS
jgi:hypothetical protein